MTQRHATLCLFGVAMAMLAALSGACLPGGLLPKRGGACGRALCDCDPHPVPSKPAANSCCHAEEPAAPGHVVFTKAPSEMRDGTPAMAFQLVWLGALLPVALKVPVAHLAAETLGGSTAMQWSPISGEIPTPPPRS